MTHHVNVVFVCVENSNRSQMAEAFARLHGGEDVTAYSAGSRPSGTVNPKAIAALQNFGYDLSKHHSKSLDALPPIEVRCRHHYGMRRRLPAYSIAFSR